MRTIPLCVGGTNDGRFIEHENPPERLPLPVAAQDPLTPAGAPAISHVVIKREVYKLECWEEYSTNPPTKVFLYVHESLTLGEAIVRLAHNYRPKKVKP